MGRKLSIDLETLKILHGQGLSDAEIAHKLGCSRKTIEHRRKEVGIPANQHPSIDEEKAKTIIQMFLEGRSGGEICRTFHLSNATLVKFKRKHNIQSAFEMKMSEEDIEKAMQMATEGYMDSEIARVFGVTAGAIMFHRKRRGVKSQFSYNKISKIDDSKFKVLFEQGLSDQKIATELGVTADGIYTYRIRHGYLRESYSLAKPKKLSFFQKQVLIGTMLGDASFKLGKGVKNPAVSCAHCVAQKEYCEYKAHIFESLGAKANYHKRNIPDKRNGKCYEDYTLFLPSNPELLDWYKAFYPRGKKVIPFNLLQKYFTKSLLLLCLWMMVLKLLLED